MNKIKTGDLYILSANPSSCFKINARDYIKKYLSLNNQESVLCLLLNVCTHHFGIYVFINGKIYFLNRRDYNFFLLEK